MIDDNSVIEPEDQFGPPGEAYREIIREQKQLITELADALEYSTKFIHEHCADGHPDSARLLHRARETTRG